MYRSHTDAEANNLCTNAEDYNLWELKYRCNFKFRSNPFNFLTSHIISCINNMINNISKMCRISYPISLFLELIYDILKGIQAYLSTLEAKLKENNLISKPRKLEGQICYYSNALKILPSVH